MTFLWKQSYKTLEFHDRSVLSDLSFISRVPICTIATPVHHLPNAIFRNLSEGKVVDLWSRWQREVSPNRADDQMNGPTKTTAVGEKGQEENSETFKMGDSQICAPFFLSRAQLGGFFFSQSFSGNNPCLSSNQHNFSESKWGESRWSLIKVTEGSLT